MNTDSAPGCCCTRSTTASSSASAGADAASVLRRRALRVAAGAGSAGAADVSPWPACSARLLGTARRLDGLAAGLVVSRIGRGNGATLAAALPLRLPVRMRQHARLFAAALCFRCFGVRLGRRSVLVALDRLGLGRAGASWPTAPRAAARRCRSRRTAARACCRPATDACSATPIGETRQPWPPVSPHRPDRAAACADVPTRVLTPRSADRRRAGPSRGRWRSPACSERR